MFHLISDHRSFMSLIRLILGVLVAGLLSVPASPASADEVDVWLEERGLTRLLIDHLEQSLSSMGSEKRAETTLRLARLYSELLAETDDRAQRIILEERSKRLLDEVSGVAAEALRLEILHSAYLNIEESAERHRLRVLDQSDVGKIVDDIRVLIDSLDMQKKRVQGLIKQRSRSLGTRRTRGTGLIALNSLEEMESRIEYLSGWCHYYLGWLTGSIADIEVAEQAFSRILKLEQVDPEQVSRDLRSSPAISWTIIGMALTSSIRSSDSIALRWLDLLDESNVPEDIRDQVPGWRLAVLLEHGRFSQAFQLLKAMEYLPGGRPISWVRLAAVVALEHHGEPEADLLAAEALVILAVKGELAQIQDIVDRYGDAVGLDAFAFNYARAIMDFRYAQELTDAVPPASEADRGDAWRRALNAIEHAMNSGDAVEYESASNQVLLLKAWCLYHLHRYEQSRDLFLALSNDLKDLEAAESLWMAYVSEERRCVRDSISDGDLRDDLASQYFDRFPMGQRAGELRLQRASRSNDPTRAQIDELMRVPLDSDAYPAARMRAADILYKLYREADRSQKADAAAEYLAMAVTMMQEDHRRGDDVSADRSVARARRVLEVATHPDVRRFVAAESALQILRNRPDHIEAADAELDDEVDYRELLMCLTREEIPRAQAIGDRLHARNPDSIWSKLGVRRLLQHARQHVRTLSGSARTTALESIIRNGDYLLSAFPSLITAVESPDGRLVAFSVAEASAELWFERGVESLRDQAWEIYGALLEHAPRDKSFLTARGRLASQIGQIDEALRCWRIVTAGSRQGSDDWFEARTHILEALAASDADRAREVMTQHLALFPEYGPDLWAERLKRIADELGMDRPAPTSTEGS